MDKETAMKSVARQWWVPAAVAALLAGVGPLGTPGTQAQELPVAPKNLDFEGPPQPGGFPGDWGGGGAGYELTVDTKIMHDGKQSGRVAFIGKDERKGTGFGTLTQGILPDPFRGQRVRYSGYVRTEKVEGSGAGMWMRVDGPQEGRSLAFDNMSDRRIVGTTEWKRCEIVLDVPKEATAIYFGMLLAGSGTAWVDDLKIETVAADTPLTDLTKSAVAKNMDFEAPLAGGRFPPGWGGGGEGYEIAVDEKVAHAGKQSGRIHHAAGAADAKAGFGTLTQCLVAADTYRGGRVRFSGFVRTDKVDGGWAGLWMRVDGPEDKPLAFDNMATSNRAIVGTTDWKEYEIILDVPAEATQFCFGMLLSGSGTAWADDLKIEKAGAK
jgi:hypothetical protein